MPVVKLKWSNLLKLTELEFIPDFPAQLVISDEVLQTISWLTGTTGFDRRLIRCTQQGALLTAKPWSIMKVVQATEVYPEPDTPKTTTNIAVNNGILIASSTAIITAEFARVSGGSTETVYIPPNSYYWYPFSCYSVIITLVPADSLTASYVGLTAYKQ